MIVDRVRKSLFAILRVCVEWLLLRQLERNASLAAGLLNEKRSFQTGFALHKDVDGDFRGISETANVESLSVNFPFIFDLVRGGVLFRFQDPGALHLFAVPLRNRERVIPRIQIIIELSVRPAQNSPSCEEFRQRLLLAFLLRGSWRFQSLDFLFGVHRSEVPSIEASSPKAQYVP